MARERFLFNEKFISQECEATLHDLCDGYVPRGYDEKHDHPCSCICHSEYALHKPFPFPEE